MGTQLNTERIGSVIKQHVFQNTGAPRMEVRTALALNKRHAENMVYHDQQKRRK